MKTRKHTFSFKNINGYNILFVNKPTHTIHIEVVVRSGFIHETKETSGINHLLEHVLVSGWKKCNGPCIPFWNKKGATINATTNDTLMQYFIKGLSSEVDEMVEYISSVVTHPMLSKKIINNEKQAVIDELTAYSGNPKMNLYNEFYKLFYKEGLRYAQDYHLQMKNLTHLSMKDIKKEYETSFNNENMFIVICGQYDHAHVSKLFSTHLQPKKGHSFKQVDCFTHSHAIVHVPFKMEGTNLIIGFPSTVMTSFYFDCFINLLHQLLFNEMRTMRKLLYDLQIETKTNECGTVVIIEMTIRDSTVKEILYLLIKLLNDYCRKEVDSELIESCKKNVKYTYYTNDTQVDYYINSILQKNKILTKYQLISQVDKFSSSHFKSMCKSLLTFDQALCVYQSKHNAHITWDCFKV